MKGLFVGLFTKLIHCRSLGVEAIGFTQWNSYQEVRLFQRHSSFWLTVSSDKCRGVDLGLILLRAMISLVLSLSLEMRVLSPSTKCSLGCCGSMSGTLGQGATVTRRSEIGFLQLAGLSSKDLFQELRVKTSSLSLGTLQLIIYSSLPLAFGARGFLFLRHSLFGQRNVFCQFSPSLGGLALLYSIRDSGWLLVPLSILNCF